MTIHPEIYRIIDYVRRNTEATREELLHQFGHSYKLFLEPNLDKIKRSKEFRDLEFVKGGNIRVSHEAQEISNHEQKSDDRIPDASRDSSLLKGTPYEHLAATRISELLTASEIKRLIPPRLYNALRSYKRLVQNTDNLPTKFECAQGLVVHHGVELFRDKEVRSAIAKSAKVDNIERWQPAKQAAVDFVRSTGFPVQFSGHQSSSNSINYVFLERRHQYKPLRDFQIKARDIIHERMVQSEIYQKNYRSILHLPTGSGKTRVLVDTILSYLNHFLDKRISTILWCAHKHELCQQASDTIQHAWSNANIACDLNLVMLFDNKPTRQLQASITQKMDVESSCIIVTTPQKALEITSGKSDLLNPDHLRLVVIDEAHRALAPTYRKLTHALPKHCAVIGMTATPYGKSYLKDWAQSTPELLTIFHNDVIGSEQLFDDFDKSKHGNEKKFLIGRKILSRPRVFEIKTKRDIQEAIAQYQNFDPTKIEENSDTIDGMIAKYIAQDNARTQLIFRSIKDVAQDERNSMIFYAPTIQDGLTMTFMLRAHGIPTHFIHGDTPLGLRRRYIEEFKNKTCRVLCNVEILTTGFDAPQVTHIVVARPTVSRVLYEQIVGRGLRGPEFGGTSECVIIDCVDRTSHSGHSLRMGYEYWREDWDIEIEGTLGT